MTTKTMDWVTDTNVTHSEYINKSDVLDIIDRNTLDIVRTRNDIWFLPTIDPIAIIDEMMRGEIEAFDDYLYWWNDALHELKERLYIKSWAFQKDLDKITF